MQVYYTGSGFAKSMMYYNWDPQFGSNTPGHCMYIYGNGHQWKSQACDSTTGEVQHFVCEIGRYINVHHK